LIFHIHANTTYYLAVYTSCRLNRVPAVNIIDENNPGNYL